MSNSLTVSKTATQVRMARLVRENKIEIRKLKSQIEQLKEMMVTPVTVPTKRKSGAKKAVLEYIKNSNGAFNSPKIVKATGYNRCTVSSILSQFYKKGIVTRVREDGHPSRKVYFKA